jgi:hypothetical protein
MTRYDFEPSAVGRHIAKVSDEPTRTALAIVAAMAYQSQEPAGGRGGRGYPGSPEDGILEVRVPKAEEEKPKKISPLDLCGPSQAAYVEEQGVRSGPPGTSRKTRRARRLGLRRRAHRLSSSDGSRTRTAVLWSVASGVSETRWPTPHTVPLAVGGSVPPKERVGLHDASHHEPARASPPSHESSTHGWSGTKARRSEEPTASE